MAISSFREKNKKIFKTNPITTLDMKHNSLMTYFKTRKTLLPKKQRLLGKLQFDYNKLSSKSPDTITEIDIQQKSELKDKIVELQTEINDIENNIGEMSYYTKTVDILTPYYEITNNKMNNLTDLNEIEELKKIGIIPKSEEISDEPKSALDKLNELTQKNRPRKPTI